MKLFNAGSSPKTPLELDQESSDRLNLIRFPLIVGVVFIHAYSTTVGVAGGEEIGLQENGYVVQFLRDLISRVLASSAVPTFFLVSGFLFYYRFSGSRSEYTRKFKSRVNTLVVPFFFWNLLVLLLLALAEINPLTSGFISGKSQSVLSYTFLGYLDAVLGITRNPISYQFWFIRDLIVLVAITPLLTILLKRAPAIALMLIGTIWYLNLWPLNFPSAEALTAFFAGGMLAVKNISPFSLDRFGKAILGIYLIVAIADALIMQTQIVPLFHNAGVIIGIASALYLTKALINAPQRIKFHLTWLSMASFFIFAAHEPLLSVLRNTSFRVINPTTDIELLTLYFFVPVSVIVALAISYRILGYLLPRPLRIVSGGR